MKWDETREDYANWAATTPLKAFFAKHFMWRGVSLWWETLPMQRDNISDPEWYSLLHTINEDEIPRRYYPKKRSLASLFFRDLINWFLVRLFFNTRKKPVSEGIWFHSIDYNLKPEEDYFVDKNYSTAPFSDIRNYNNSSYLLKVYLNKSIFKKGAQKRKLEIYGGLNRPFWVCDEYLRFRDILIVHSIVCFYSIKLWLLLKINNKYDFFTVGGKDATAILEPMLKASFFGSLQASLLYALSMERFFKNFSKPQTIITYGELLPEFKYVYHFVQLIGIGHKFLSVQHSYSGKNKLFHYYKRSDIQYQIPGDAMCFSPRPDFYLVQGDQFRKVLSEYFPAECIYVIGVLKYDNYIEILRSRESIKNQVFQNIGRDDRSILLVVFSIGDEGRILSVLRNFDSSDRWRIIISPHPVIRDVTMKKINQIPHLKGKVEYFADISTNELNQVADLVLGGYSATIFESLIFGVSSMYACGVNDIPYLDDDSSLPKCENADDLKMIMSRLESKENIFNVSNVSKAVERHFYKIDGKAKQRLWDVINKINKTQQFLQ